MALQPAQSREHLRQERAGFGQLALAKGLNFGSRFVVLPESLGGRAMQSLPLRVIVLLCHICDSATAFMVNSSRLIKNKRRRKIAVGSLFYNKCKFFTSSLLARMNLTEQR